VAERLTLVGLLTDLSERCNANPDTAHAVHEDWKHLSSMEKAVFAGRARSAGLRRHSSFSDLPLWEVVR
jgi:hypothetical protein